MPSIMPAGQLMCPDMKSSHGKPEHEQLPYRVCQLQVYAYALGSGGDLGSFQAHDDAVSCLVQPESSPDLLLTGSWDSTVRCWR